MIRSASPLILAAMLAGLAGCSNDDERGFGDVGGAPGFPAIALIPVAEGFSEPVQIVDAGDGSGRLFVVERSGLVRLLQNGDVRGQPWLDLRTFVKTQGPEQGLLSIAFPPELAQRRHFYVVYTDQTDSVVLARYGLLADSDEVDPGSGEVLLTVSKPFANHNGGGTAFGPDGKLYLSLGDGGGANDPLGNGQNIDTLLGTLLRLDVEAGASDGSYAVPADNPFVAASDGRSEIWAYGLRNPWRFSFDRITGDLYIADVGQARYEEINFQPLASAGGENYGWSLMEGAHCFRTQSCDAEGAVPPVAEYSHDGGDCSVTGGYVYRGQLHPELRGIYFYGDFCSGRIRGLRRNGGDWRSEVILDSDLQISSFGQNQNGELLVADYGEGVIYRIERP